MKKRTITDAAIEVLKHSEETLSGSEKYVRNIEKNINYGCIVFTTVE